MFSFSWIGCYYFVELEKKDHKIDAQNGNSISPSVYTFVKQIKIMPPQVGEPSFSFRLQILYTNICYAQPNKCGSFAFLIYSNIH